MFVKFSYELKQQDPIKCVWTLKNLIKKIIIVEA